VNPRTLMDCAQAVLMHSSEDARIIADAAEEIERLRAENIHLRRAGMDRPSAELHEAAMAELRAENERLRARGKVLERALHGIAEFCAEGDRRTFVAIANTVRAALEAKP